MVQKKGLFEIRLIQNLRVNKFDSQSVIAVMIARIDGFELASALTGTISIRRSPVPIRLQ